MLTGTGTEQIRIRLTLILVRSETDGWEGKGADVKKKFMFLLKVWAVMVACGFAVLFVVGIVIGIGLMTGEVGAVVTQEEFECVRNGMTYRQVVECIGQQGTETMSTANPLGGGQSVTYTWTNPDMTSASVMFDNGRVTMKMSMLLP